MHFHGEWSGRARASMLLMRIDHFSKLIYWQLARELQQEVVFDYVEAGVRSKL